MFCPSKFKSFCSELFVYNSLVVVELQSAAEPCVGAAVCICSSQAAFGLQQLAEVLQLRAQAGIPNIPNTRNTDPEPGAGTLHEQLRVE